MKTSTRLTLSLAMLLIGCGARFWLTNHLSQAVEIEVGQLAAPIDQLPLQLGDWHGEDLPIDDPKLLYADEHLQRIYVHQETGQKLKLWMARSSQSEDRKHHPEVCMAVAGQPEVVSGRKNIELPGHERPVQQFQFGTQGRQMLVYYWHYTVRSEQVGQLDDVQRLYQKLHAKPASVTIEVFMPTVSARAGDEATARQFVADLDRQLQSIIGPDAIRGCSRTPVTVAGL